MPLWWFPDQVTNPATQDEIRKQLREFRDQGGYAGVAPLFLSSRGYLTDDYWARYGFILEACRELGMKVVFYDDVSFPSGSAGNWMKKMFPDDTACRLDLLEEEVAGPQSLERELKALKRVVMPSEQADPNSATRWEKEFPKAMVVGAVAMNMETKERRDISSCLKDQHLVWDAPAGTWKVMVFTLVRPCGYVDYLCPESIEKFFSLTYDEYFKRFPSYFGSTIIMTYFDDVGVRGGGGFGTERRNWTPAFNEKFQKAHGFNPMILYPALWYDIGKETESARALLFGFRAELLAEGYPRKVHEWAQKHGLKSSGHAMGQYKEQPAFMAGDNIRFYRHSDVPMMDSIGAVTHGRPGYKFTSSAATSYNRSLTAVEIYGIYGKTEDITPEMVFRAAMELFARGANVVLPHGVWYDPQKVVIPPEISHRNPRLAPILPGYNEWVGRCSWLLRGGRPSMDVAVFYPVCSMLAHAKLNAIVDQRTVPGSTHPGDYVPPGSNLMLISDKLTGEIRRDFTYLHPEILQERCSVKPGVLRLENSETWQEYRVVVMPYGQIIDLASLKKLKEFVDAGGKLIATAPLPYRVGGKPVALPALPCKSVEFGKDKEVAEIAQAIFGFDPDHPPTEEPFSKRSTPGGGGAYFVPSLAGDGFKAALDDAQACPDVAFAEPTPKFDPKKGMLSYLHKQKEGRNIYYVANSTDEPVETEVTIRGAMALESWNPYDGSITKLATQKVSHAGQDCTRFPVKLEPMKAVFLVEKAGAK